MTQVESAWSKYPDYVINVVPLGSTVRVWRGDVLVAESDAALRPRRARTSTACTSPSPTCTGSTSSRRSTTRCVRSRAKPTTGPSPRVTSRSRTWCGPTAPRSTRSPASPGTSRSTRRRCASRSSTSGATIRGRSRATASRRGATRATCSASSTCSPWVTPTPGSSSPRLPDAAQRRGRRPDPGRVDRGGVEDAARPACHLRVDDLHPFGVVRRSSRLPRRRAAAGSHLLDRGGAGRAGREAAQRRPAAPRQRVARRDPRRGRDARRARALRLGAVRLRRHRTGPARRRRDVLGRPGAGRAAGDQHLGAVPATTLGRSTSTPR